MSADPQPSSEDHRATPPAAHWPNPAGEYAAGASDQKREAEEIADRLEQIDPKALHSAAPGDGTGVTGTVPPT